MATINDEEFENALQHSLLYKDMEETRLLARNLTKESNDPVLIDRRKQQLLRNQLQSSHGITAEHYDQFYRDHKLLLTLFVFLGVMPIVRSAPGRITFNWKSKEMIYAAILYIFTSILVFKVGYERVQILTTTNAFDEYIYAIIFIIFLIPHFAIPYVGWGVASQVAAYKTMWGSFQVRYYRVTGTTLTFPTLNLWIIILFIGCVVQSICFLVGLSNLLEGFLLRHTIAYFHIMTTINMNTALFFINSKAMQEASIYLSLCLKKDLKLDCSAKLVYRYRLLWLNLSEILQSFGTAYARTYSTHNLFMMVNITVSVYGALTGVIDSGFSLKVLGLLCLAIYCAALLFITCDCSYRATSVLAHNVQNILLTFNVLDHDAPTRKEIDYFISAIEVNPPVVNMQGYGIINRELLSSTISTITIYLIVLLQFKLSFV